MIRSWTAWDWVGLKLSSAASYCYGRGLDSALKAGALVENPKFIAYGDPGFMDSTEPMYVWTPGNEPSV